MTRKPITFASVKVYCLIFLICPIMLLVTLRNFFLSVSFIVSVNVCIFPLNMPDIVIYVALWWEKYLSKRRPLKHTYIVWRIIIYKYIRMITFTNHPVMLNMLFDFNSNLITLGKLFYVYKHWWKLSSLNEHTRMSG